jgi:hypothetical protein
MASMPPSVLSFYQGLQSHGCLLLRKNVPFPQDGYSYCVLSGSNALHGGRVSVPHMSYNGFLACCERLHTQGGVLALSEVPTTNDTAIRKVYVESDLKISLNDVKEMSAVCAFIDLFQMEGSAFDQDIFGPEGHNMRLSTERVRELSLMDALDDVGLTDEDVDGALCVSARATWYDVVKALGEKVRTDNVVPPAVHEPWCVKLLAALWNAALGVVIQKVLQDVFALKQGDFKCVLAVMIYDGRNAFKPSDKDGLYNFGAHFVAPSLFVTGPHARFILNKVHREIQDHPSSAPFRDLTKTIIDTAVCSRGGGNLRTVFSQKTTRCSACKTGSWCPVCANTHVLAPNKWYALLCVLGPNKKVLKNLLAYTKLPAQFKLTTITAKPTDTATPSAMLDALFTVAADLETITPAERKRVAGAMSTADDDAVARAVYAERVHMGARGKARRSKSDVPLDMDSEQGRSISSTFASVWSAVSGRPCTFTVSCVMTTVDDVGTIVYLSIYLSPKVGILPGRWCENKMARHKTTNTVYFQVHREDQDGPKGCTITQL